MSWYNYELVAILKFARKIRTFIFYLKICLTLARSTIDSAMKTNNNVQEF